MLHEIIKQLARFILAWVLLTVGVFGTGVLLGWLWLTFRIAFRTGGGFA